jgi:hypothetical protein
MAAQGCAAQSHRASLIVSKSRGSRSESRVFKCALRLVHRIDCFFHKTFADYIIDRRFDERH